MTFSLEKFDMDTQSMSDVGGRPKPKHFKRTTIVDEGAAGGGAPLDEPVAEATGNAPPPPPPPPAADDAAPANLATPPAKNTPKLRSGSGGAGQFRSS
jgi:hypothetical protein